MDAFRHFVDVFLHLDKHLNEWAESLGPWLYVVLFLIIFCETALVVTPFLPGDSLLFAVGALSATEGSPIRITEIVLLLIVAAIAGDAVNYSIGKYFGPRVFRWQKSRLFNPDHLVKTQRFYEKYGGKTIILARFVPIVRTFAPFVAGIGKMQYRRFAMFNVVGGILWVAGFAIAGYAFGGLEAVKKNFQYVILAIIVVSVLPIVFEVWRARRAKPAVDADA
jgi:membrane-associated protein